MNALSKYKTYPEYKDSGVEWLGEIPSNWDTLRLKSQLNERNEKNDPIKTKNVLSLTMTQGVIPFSERDSAGGNKPKDDLSAYKLAHVNDIVLNSMNVIVGSVGLSKYFGAISPVYYALYTTDNQKNIHFYNYIFQAQCFQNNLIRLGTGILIKKSESSGKLNTIRMKISMENLGNEILPLISLHEQTKIAQFLDYETAKIDQLIEKQQKLIELLKEKRQAVISHAVTKGLDPNVKMKDSGVEWLGKVPEHWILLRLKNVLKIRNGRDYKNIEVEDGGYPVYGSGGIFKRASSFLHDGISILFGRKGTIDKPLLVNGRFWTVDTMFYSEINTLAIPYFIYYHSTLFPFSLLSTSTALPSMTQEDLLHLNFVLPPKTEQQKINNFLKIKTTKIDLLTLKAEQQIELMKERRTALISAAVTGKIDVRDWQIPN